jgi:hypothetical protein
MSEQRASSMDLSRRTCLVNLSHWFSPISAQSGRYCGVIPPFATPAPNRPNNRIGRTRPQPSRCHDEKQPPRLTVAPKSSGGSVCRYRKRRSCPHTDTTRRLSIQQPAAHQPTSTQCGRQIPPQFQVPMKGLLVPIRAHVQHWLGTTSHATRLRTESDNIVPRRLGKRSVTSTKAGAGLVIRTSASGRKRTPVCGSAVWVNKA